MRLKNRNRGSVSAALLLVTVAAALPANAAIIEFSEVPLSNNDVLAGSEAFAAYGIHFIGSTKFAIDPRFVGAGVDDKGITTGVSSPIMGVSFDTPASSVSFDGVAVNTDFYATLFDKDSNEIASFSLLAPLPGTHYVSATFSGVGDIARIEFHDHNNFIGVGRLSINEVPEPAAAGIVSIIAAACLSRRSRRH